MFLLFGNQRRKRDESRGWKASFFGNRLLISSLKELLERTHGTSFFIVELGGLFATDLRYLSIYVTFLRGKWLEDLAVGNRLFPSFADISLIYLLIY